MYVCIFSLSLILNVKNQLLKYYGIVAQATAKIAQIEGFPTIISRKSQE